MPTSFAICPITLPKPVVLLFDSQNDADSLNTSEVDALSHMKELQSSPAGSGVNNTHMSCSLRRASPACFITWMRMKR